MTRTLAELETEIRWKYDIEGFTARHTQAAIFRQINAAYRALRTKLASAGYKGFNKASEATRTEAGEIVSASGKNAPHNGTVFRPTVQFTGSVYVGYKTIDSIAVKDGSRWVPLRLCNQTASEYDVDGLTTGTPHSWAPIGLSNEVAVAGLSNIPGIEVEVWPAAGEAYTYRVDGLPNWIDLTTGTDEIWDVIGALDHVVACVGVDLIGRDEDVTGAIVQARYAEREATYQACLKAAKAMMPNETRRANVRGRGRWNR